MSFFIFAGMREVVKFVGKQHPMKHKMTRLCIYPKDVQRITGRSLGYSRTLLAELRKKLGKDRKDFISVAEFCTYTGLNQDDVCTMIHT